MDLDLKSFLGFLDFLGVLIADCFGYLFDRHNDSDSLEDHQSDFQWAL
jgi:hypothetical protein